MDCCTIVMYHYVRKIKNTKFSNIKGLELNLFHKQIKYFKKNYNFINYFDLLESIYNNKKLPINPILLTFDDGFSDNYNYIFPILVKENIKACFFPVGSSIIYNKVLDVHKIHFILSMFSDYNKLIKKIYETICIYEKDYKYEQFLQLYDKLAIPNIFDNKNVIFIKRLLQHELSYEIRNKVLKYLFNKYVNENEKNFSKYLYLNLNQIEEMIHKGMVFGHHGFEHLWLGEIDKKRQEKEIDNGFNFLTNVLKQKHLVDKWPISYPYGSFNKHTIQLCEKLNCKVGLTTKFKISELQYENRFTLNRLDTNHFLENIS